MNYKIVGVLAALAVSLTLIWLAQVIGVSIRYGTLETFDQALAFAREAHWFFYQATYINAVLLTLVNVLLFAGLYALLKDEQPVLAAAGLAVMPLYGILALFSYLSQLTLVPTLIAQLADSALAPMANTLLHHLIQLYPHSTLILFDQFSYFLLGIPSLIDGLLLWRIRPLRVPGALFTLSGAACLLIGPGVLGGFRALIDGPSMFGGVLSIFACGWLAYRLLVRPQPSRRPVLGESAR